MEDGSTSSTVNHLLNGGAKLAGYSLWSLKSGQEQTKHLYADKLLIETKKWR